MLFYTHYGKARCKDRKRKEKRCEISFNIVKKPEQNYLNNFNQHAE